MGHRPELTLRINKVHHPVTSLGFGRRIGVWFQGCSIGCAGCVSRDTWEPSAVAAVRLSELVAHLGRIISGPGGAPLDGITISGGEPFDQAPALEAVLRAMRPVIGPRADLLLYSGYSLERLQATWPAVLRQADAVICDPYVERRSLIPLRGSDNQRLVPLSPLGHERYGPGAEGSTQPVMQLAVADGQVWFIGIPQRGDMERLRISLARRGVELEDVSWRA